MKKEIFKGAGTAISTPFEGDEVNYKAYDRLLDYQLDNDIDAIIVCGTTGQSATMDSDEKKRLIEHTLEKVDGRAKVIAGTGGAITQKKQLQCQNLPIVLGWMVFWLSLLIIIRQLKMV